MDQLDFDKPTNKELENKYQNIDMEKDNPYYIKPNSAMLEKKYGKVNLEDNFIKALKNQYFKKVVNSIDLPDEIKYMYTSRFLDVASKVETCANCKGLATCPYDLKGLYEMPEQDGENIKFVYKKCPYKEKYDKSMAYLDNIYEYKMPKEIKEASFKKIYKDDSNRLETVRELKNFYDNYLKDKKIKGMYLHGNFGCGKTYLVAALFNELAKKNNKSTIIYYPEFLRSLKASFGGDNDEYNNRFDQIKYSPLLLLDDIGAEKNSDWARDEVLGVILQYRMEEHLPTFFTSNLTLDELEDHLSLANNRVDSVKARRIIERIKYLCNDITMISVNRRN